MTKLHVLWEIMKTEELVLCGMNSDEEVWILINMEKQTTLKFIYRIEYESREAH